MVRRMRLRPVFLALLAVAVAAVPALAGWAGTYKGRATSVQGDFEYGKVTVKAGAGKVKNIKIEGVTTTGYCGGYMTLVFAPGDPSTQIIGGSAKIKNGRMTVKYRPDRTVEDQDTFIDARFKGGKVTGRFQSLGLCQNEGKFRATR